MSYDLPTEVMVARARYLTDHVGRSGLGPFLAQLANRLAAYDGALAAIATAGDGGPWSEVYRAAGGGYEGLQAIAEAARTGGWP